MDLTEKYIRYISSVRRYSDKTARTYHDVLRDFMQYAMQDEAIHEGGYSDMQVTEALNPGMIRSYEVYLMDSRKMIPRTVNLHLSVLSGFCRFLMKEKILTSNPARAVTRPKMPKRLPLVYKQAALERYFRETEIFSECPLTIPPEAFMERYRLSRERGYRPESDPVMLQMLKLSADPGKFMTWLYERQLRRTMIAALFGTGMRRSELVCLNVTDFDRYRKILRVTGKGDKTREIPLTGSLCKEILLYLQSVEMICGGMDREPALFVTAKGRRVYPEYVDRAVKAEFGESGGFTEKKSPHVLRHTIATELLDEGTDLYSIKELLGHSSLAATQVYTHNSIEKLKKVYQTAHPRAKNGGKNGD